MGKSANNKSVVLVGGPDAGKTNYLGRLWTALDAESGAISKNGLPPKVEYLRAIASSLHSGEFSLRTAPGVFESTSIPVKWDGGGSFGQLIVPDCAGEQWEKIHLKREWDSRWEQAISSMAGCIIFFRGTSTHNVEPLNWSNNAEVMKLLKQSVNASSEPPKLPTQVLLVDWLQCLSVAYRDIQGIEQPLRVSVVLSAWDLAPKEAREADPDEYLSTHLPLLQDFLQGNPMQFRSKTFGVSIAGGVLTDEDTSFMKKYLKEDPNKSGYVVLANGKKILKSIDLTLPVAWAFGCDCPEFGQPGIAKR
jgi:hypothetical protein